MVRQIIGAKGGGGGSSFITKPDTLRSNDSFEILLGLGSGRWKGLVNGLQSFKINGVPLENDNGTSNFENVFLIFADGNPLEDQIVNFTLGGGGNSQTVNTQLANANPSGPGGWVSGAVLTPGANFIDLRFIAQQLFYQDKKSIRENTATIEIEMRPSGTSTWINIFAAPTSNTTVYDPAGYDYIEDYGGYTGRIYLSQNMFNPGGVGFRAGNGQGMPITGKTSSAFVKEIRVSVPNTGDYANKTWEVRARLVEKDTVDNGDIQERRNILFETITAIINEPLGDDPEWDGLVWAKVHGKASDQFNGFPEMTGIFDTKICKVPPGTVFNPETRAYTVTTWDGSYVEAFTTDPAWQIKEFVEDPIHGLAGLNPGATLDKWDALEASKYFSELVPDGQGGFHPRFSMNYTINEAKEVDEQMQFLAGAVNSYTEDIGGGVWRFKVDKPETPIMLFTEDNIFGEFSYAHSPIDTRFNDWRGTFLDETLDYETNTVRVFDQPDIDANGTKFTEVALIGCTHPQEALRRLMFRLRVSLNEYKMVTFSTNRVGRLISPLSTILVADGALNPNHLIKSTSRLHSYGGTSVTLKRPVRLQAGVTYKMKFTTTDMEVVERTVTNSSGLPGDFANITLNSALPGNIMPESAVALEAVGLAALPVAYRVVGVERSEDNEDEYTISAVFIDVGKWDAMDNVDADALAAQESVISIGSPTVPDDGMFQVLDYTTEFQVKKVLQVNWNRPSSMFLDGFQVEYRLNDGQWRIGAALLKDSIFELQNPEDGTYDFKITALDRRGVKSNPLLGRFEFDGDAQVTPPAHDRGEIGDRPTEGLYNGYRYTATDTNPPVTFVWDAALNLWVPENNLVTEGSQIGVENGATVGMTPTQAALFAAAQAAIDELFETYGDTASASAAALAAEAARDDAIDAATAAGGYATTASVKRDEAEGFMEVAQAAAVTASLAAAGVGLTKNSQFTQGVSQWVDTYISNQDYATPADFTPKTDFNGAADVVSNTSNARRDIRGSLASVSAGRKYRLRARYWNTTTTHIIFGITFYTADGEPYSTLNYYSNVTTPAATWVEVNQLIVGADFAALPLIAPYAITNYVDEGRPSAADVALDYLYIEDVTESENAAISASAATASAAAASADAASAATSSTLSAAYASQRAMTPNADFKSGTQLWSRYATLPEDPVLINGGWAASDGGALGVWYNTPGVGSSNLYSVLTPINTSRKYKIRGRVYSSGHTGHIYVGATSHDANGTPIGTDNGHNYITGWTGATKTAGWHDIESQVLTGEGASVDIGNWFRLGTKQVRIFAFLNYNSAASQQYVLDSLWLEDVTDSVESATQAGVATSQAAAATASAAAASTSQTLSAQYMRQGIVNDGNLGFENGFEGWSVLATGYQDATTPTIGGPNYLWGPAFDSSTVIMVLGSIGTKELFSKKTFPIDPARKYKIRGRFGAYNSSTPGASAIIYAGFVGLDTNYDYVSHGAYGTYRYALLQGATFNHSGAFPTFEVIVTGTGNDSWTKFPPGTTQVRLMAIMNYANSSLNTYCDFLTIEDVTEVETAVSSASISTAQAAIATAQASAAQTSQLLTASMGKGYMNPNANFAAWPDANLAPQINNMGWAIWDGGVFGGGVNRRLPITSLGLAANNRPEGSDWCYAPVVPNSTTYVGLLTVPTEMAAGPGLYTVDATSLLMDGTNVGSGILVYCFNSSVSVIHAEYIRFWVDPDLAGNTGSNFQMRRWSRNFTAPAGTTSIRMYAMANWNGFPTGATAAKTIAFLNAGIKPADETAATVLTQAAVLATHTTKLATWLTRVAAGSGTAEIAISALDSGGSTATSIALRADSIVLGSLTQPALSIVGGVSTFTGELNVGTTTGARVNITKDLIRVYDSAGTLRVRLGVW